MFKFFKKIPKLVECQHDYVKVYRHHGIYHNQPFGNFPMYFPVQIGFYCKNCKKLNMDTYPSDILGEPVTIVNVDKIGIYKLEDMDKFPKWKDGWQWTEAFTSVVL